MEEHLLKQIEAERQILNSIVNLYGLSSPQVLQQSQWLDLLLNAYESENNKSL